MQNPLPKPTANNEDSDHKHAKVLILGAAESGKSTICRHMRQLHGQQFSDAEILQFKKAIRASCLQHFHKTIKDLLLDPTLHLATKEICAELLQKHENKSNIDREYLEEAVKIWKIPLVQEYIVSLTTLYNVTENNHDESFELAGITKQKELLRLHSDNPGNLFLRKFDSIMSEGYSPKLEDILSIRIPTTGISHRLIHLIYVTKT